MTTGELTALAVCVFWLLLSAAALRSLRMSKAREAAMRRHPAGSVIRSGDYTHDELEALRPFAVCDWPAAMEQIRAAEREARLEADVLDDDAFVAAVVRGWER